jgi:hypothetical protein
MILYKGFYAGYSDGFIYVYEAKANKLVLIEPSDEKNANQLAINAIERHIHDSIEANVEYENFLCTYLTSKQFHDWIVSKNPKAAKQPIW